ncbi:alpha/beta fold hydrolase [Streptosporangium lutulentum]
MSCPVLVLWGEHGFVGQTYDVLDAWRGYAADVRGQSLPCDHYLAEEEPEATAKLLGSFLSRTPAATR